MPKVNLSVVALIELAFQWAMRCSSGEAMDARVAMRAMDADEVMKGRGWGYSEARKFDED